MKNIYQTNLINIHVYEESFHGHRGDYILVLNNIFLVTLIKKINFKKIFELINCKYLLFPTCDEHFLKYFILSNIRTILGKKTCGIVLRSWAINNASKPSNDYIKKICFHFLIQFNKKTLSLPILPLTSTELSNGVFKHWVYDFQLWDVPYLFNKESNNIGDDISSAIQQFKNKTLIVSLGSQNKAKGSLFLLDLAQIFHDKNDDIGWILAGDCSRLDSQTISALKLSGCIVIDRVISNDEVFYLYTHANYVWATYDPAYNQSSGIFSRSIQFNKKIIIRQGSKIHELWLSYFPKASCLTVPYNDAVDSYNLIKKDMCTSHTQDNADTTQYQISCENKFRNVVFNFFED